MKAFLTRPLEGDWPYLWIGATAFVQDTAKAASAQWRTVADQVRIKVPKLAALRDEAEHNVLAYMSSPKEHPAKLQGTKPIERLNGEIKRRTDVVGIFPNDDAIVRLLGALLLEHNDEWAVQRARYLTPETIAPMGDGDVISLPCRVILIRQARAEHISVTITPTYTTPRDTI